MAKGYVEINKKACKGCWYCVSVCPKKVLAEGDEANAKGFLTVTKANPDDCIGGIPGRITRPRRRHFPRLTRSRRRPSPGAF